MKGHLKKHIMNTIKNNNKNTKKEEVKLGRHKINIHEKRKFRTTLVANDIEWDKIKRAAKEADCSVNNYIIQRAIEGIKTSSELISNHNQTELF